MKGFEDKQKNIVVPWGMVYPMFEEIAKKKNLKYKDVHKERRGSYSRWQKEDIENKGIKEIIYDSTIAGHNIELTLNFIKSNLVFVVCSLKEKSIIKQYVDIYKELRKREGTPSNVKNFDIKRPEKILEENEEEINPAVVWQKEGTTIRLEIIPKFSSEFYLTFYKLGDEKNVSKCQRTLCTIRAYK